jgi:hypothetical protein
MQYFRNSNAGNGYQGHLNGRHFPGFLLEGKLQFQHAYTANATEI